jgi:PAS domain S-box-containing protein
MKLNIRQKMVLIVITGILLSAVLGTVLIYKLVQHKVLANEIINLEQVTAKFTSVASQRFSESEPKLKSLAKLLETELAKPIQKNEIKSFHQLFELNADSVWRNRKPNFNGQFEAGVFLPPNSHENDAQKIQHLRIKQIMDIFGASATKRFENVWYLSPSRSEIIFDKNYPEFVFEQKADNDYTQTPWVTYATPQLNPNKELRFTPPLFDPVVKAWMVSAIYPLYVNNEWIGSLGEDMELTNVLEFIFQSNQLYSNAEHFLIDTDGNFVLAGSWQKELETSTNSFKPNFEKEQALTTLFTQSLTNIPKLLTDNLTLHGERYIALGMILEPLNWRYYRLVPVDQIMSSTRELFLNLLEMILFVSVINGLLVFTMTGKTITNRIKTLTESMNNYVNNHHIRASNKVFGFDEISNAARAFDEMANRIETSQKLSQESERWFRLLADSAPVLIWTSKKDKLCDYFNQVWLDFSGHTFEQLLGNGWAEDVHVDDFQRCLDTYVNAFDARQSFQMEYRLRRYDGEYRWILDTGVPRFVDNEFVGYVGSCVDITELKTSERKLTEINADLLQFTHISAHHLQEPARRIVSFVQRLKDILKNQAIFNNDEVMITLQFIEQGAIRQRALVRDIQLYLAAQQPRAVIESVPVIDVLTNVLKHHAPLIKKIAAKIEYGELPAVTIDRPRLYDIFNILLDNALHYYQPDSLPKIHIHGELKNGRVFYYVEDKGIGIPSEYRERVFLVFERLQVNKNQESTGIGLAIVRRIIESCGGTVYLTETKGGGTTVIFDLPAETKSIL